MVITYHGGECFKITFGDTTIAVNPISKDSKLKPVRFGADIALVSMQHPDLNGVDQVGYGDRQPFVVSGPGEYEIKGTVIRGYLAKTKFGPEEENYSTIYLINLEGMNLCFMGPVSSSDLPKEAKEAFEDVDVLFVPIGGEGVLSPSQAHELAVNLEPNIVIPMHFGELGEADALKKFLKEEGSDVKPIDKLTLKKKDLEGKEGETVVLQS